MKKLCFVTAARSEYGLLKWIMKDVDASDAFDLQLIVTGAHLLHGQGHTIDQIISDGFLISDVVNTNLDDSSQESIAESMGKMAQAFSHSFAKLSPNYVIVLGDRYELLPIVNTAFIMRIPIIHISGGDVTEGALDDGIRNAITMLADYHFPGTEESANNIIRMKGSTKNVWSVGEPGLDSFNREKLNSRAELATNLNLDPARKWVLFTFHPETKQNTETNLDTVKICLSKLLSLDSIQIVATYSNTDFGGKEINQLLEAASQNHPEKLRVIPSLGIGRYLSFMKETSFLVGNSSSGIVEAPVLGIPVVNIGNRQKGRHLCSNIIQADLSENSINNAIDSASSTLKLPIDNYWGDGHTAEKILEILRKELL